MNNSIQWPKAGDVLGDFVLNSALEITSARARFLATHEPSDKNALIVCGTSELDSDIFMKRLTGLALCQFKRGSKIMEANKYHDFYWIASEYPECETLPSALKRKLAVQKSLQDLGQRFHLATMLGIGIASTLDRFYEAGFIHGDLDPFRTVLGLRGNRLKCILFETGFSRLFDPDFDRIRAHPLFCAPELLHGHPPSLRGDLYACAMIMRVLMLGSPFSNDPDQLLRQCQQERPVPLKQSWPNLARLSDLLDAALEKDAENRPRDWDEFLEELSLFLAEIGVLYGEEGEEEETPSAESLTFEASADSEEDERSSIPAKSKLHALVSVPAPKSANKQRLAKPSKEMRAGHPLSIVGRAGKTQGPYFQASAQCGVFRIAEAIDGLGAMRRYRASDVNTEKEALLVCARVSEADQERFKQWIEKRAGLQINGVPALLGGGVDGDLGFIGEERNKGVRLEDALPGFTEAPIELRQVLIAGSAAIVATVMHECAQAGFFHGNLDPRRVCFDVEEHFALAIHEIGLIQGLNAQLVARGNPYAAPEVREGKAWDHRADIFSYAVILHEQLTGALSDAMGDEYNGIRLRYPLPDAILRGLAANPEKRFASWIEFRDALNKTISPEMRRYVAEVHERKEWEASGGDESDSSSDSEPSSTNGSGPATSRGVPTVEPATKPWRPPSHPAMTPPPIALRQGNQGGNGAPIEQPEQAKPSSKNPRSPKSADPIPSTLRSEGVQKERRALLSAQSTSATLVRWTPSPMKVYERSPMMVFTRSPVRVYERAPLALRGPWGRLMKLDAMKKAKPFRAAFAALAVAAVVLVMLGAAILSRPKPSVLVAHSIEMAIPDLQPVSAEPARAVPEQAPKIESGHGLEQSQAPQMKQVVTGEKVRPISLAPKVEKAKDAKANSKEVKPKQSLKREMFLLGPRRGVRPNE